MHVPRQRTANDTERDIGGRAMHGGLFQAPAAMTGTVRPVR